MCVGRIGVYSISEKNAIKADAQQYLDAKAQYGTIKKFYEANPDFKTKSGYGLSTAYQTNRVLQKTANKIVAIRNADGTFKTSNYNGRDMIHAKVYNEKTAPKNATTIDKKSQNNMIKSSYKINGFKRKEQQKYEAALNKNSSNNTRSSTRTTRNSRRKTTRNSRRKTTRNSRRKYRK